METSIHEQQTHSMSRRTHRHDDGNVKFDGSGQQNYSTANETIPEAFRPLADQSIISFPSCGFSLLVMRDGKVQMLGDPKSAYSTAHGCWMALQ